MQAAVKLDESEQFCLSEILFCPVGEIQKKVKSTGNFAFYFKTLEKLEPLKEESDKNIQ